MGLNRYETVREARTIIGLAWPVMLTSLNWTLMHLIDVVIVGHAGPGELGALAAGRALTFITIVIGIAALSGIIVFTSRYDGAGEHHRCGDVLRAGLVSALVMATVTTFVLHHWSVEITRAIGIAPQFVTHGAAVVRVMALAFPAQLGMAALAYFLEGVSRPGRAMVVNMLMLPLNAILAWAWVDGHFGLPPAGAVGAVSATAVVSALGLVLTAAAVWTLPEARAMRVRDLSGAAWRKAVADAPRLIGFGALPGIASGLEMAGFSILIALSTRLGVTAVDAFQAVFSLHNFAFAVAIGMASAAGVRAGNAVGEDRREAAVDRTLAAAVLLIAGMGILVLAYILLAPWLASIFSGRAEVRLMTGQMLRSLAPFMIFDGLQFIFVYALRSLGDQIAAGVNGIIAYFMVTGATAWWLIMVAEAGPFALVAAAAAGMVAAFGLQASRFYWITRPWSPRSSG